MSGKTLSRRSFFLKAAGLVGAAALVKSGSLFAVPAPSDTAKAPASPLPQDSVKPPALEKPLTFLTDKQAKKISDAGDYEVFKLNDKKILFARLSDKEVIALSAVCTHEGCTVKYKKKENDITCWCHGSTFDLKGNVVKGPAKDNLAVYPVELKDGKIGIAL